VDLFFDWNGRPISRDGWLDLRRRGIHVALTDFGRRGRVSTVWLGLDYGFGLGGTPPVIFESMVFGGLLDGFLVRYCTPAEAARGHREMVREVRRVPGFRPLLHNGRKFRGKYRGIDMRSLLR
jgi:hypothetical protein